MSNGGDQLILWNFYIIFFYRIFTYVMHRKIDVYFTKYLRKSKRIFLIEKFI